MTIEELKQVAEQCWEGCDSCTEQDKHYNRFCQLMETNNAYYLKIKLR